jgi:hypothetical protein
VSNPPLQPGEKAGKHAEAEKQRHSKPGQNGPKGKISPRAGNDKTLHSQKPVPSRSYVIRTFNLPPSEPKYSALKRVELSPGKHPIGYVTSARLPITKEYLLGIFVANEGKYPIRWELDDRNANTSNLSGIINPGGQRVNQRMQVVPADYVLYLYCLDSSKACKAVGEISSWKIK